jgi:putative FmdB family regulatory protein
MPIYEYRCETCGKRNSFLLLSRSHPWPQACKSCGGRLERVMSRFAAPKSEEARMEALADPANFSDVDENDPQSMARFMRKMGREMGEDMGDDFEEALEGAEETPGESELTDLD